MNAERMRQNADREFATRCKTSAARIAVEAERLRIM